MLVWRVMLSIQKDGGIVKDDEPKNRMRSVVKAPKWDQDVERCMVRALLSIRRFTKFLDRGSSL
jgi:hypothetical protein